MDKRRKPGPSNQCSPKTAVGKEQKAFKEKRATANTAGWETRRNNHGPSGRRPKEPV